MGKKIDFGFWPMIKAPPGDIAQPENSGRDFQFEMVGTDLLGNQITFSMPLLFVNKTPNDKNSQDENDPKSIQSLYKTTGTGFRRIANINNATVCFAPFDPATEENGDPRLPCGSMTFAAGKIINKNPFGPNFYPEIEVASVGIKPLQKLLGKSDAQVEVKYPDIYREHGFGKMDDPPESKQNKGMVFLEFVNPYKLEFGENKTLSENKTKSDALGALASPQMDIVGLSKIIGPVASSSITNKIGNAIGGNFDPVDFFKGATILGGIEIASLLEQLSPLDKGNVPKMLSREMDDRAETRFDWETEILRSDKKEILIPGTNTRLIMHSVITTSIANPADVNYDATASLNNFKVNLFGAIIISFKELKFISRKGQKPDVTVDLEQGADAVQFGGPLEFVNELRKLIPSNGFSDPPSLAVTPSGISASYSLNLPSVSVGIFMLSGVSLGAGFSLPFDSNPASFRFNFSERQNPFSLVVSFLGGGGFFAIGLSTKGIQEIEAALEFGAAVAINLGVASGGVEIKAGVYFHWLEKSSTNGASVEITGYIRIHGELSILGLISASLTFNLQLTYFKDKENGKSTVWGEATLVIEIDLTLFSKDVSVHCRREFGGSKSDPKFVDLVPNQNVWDEYCNAFALEEEMAI